MNKKNKYKISGLEKQVSIIDILLQGLLFIFSYLIPKNSHTLLFGAGAGYIFDGNPKYLYIYSLRQTQDISAYWITKNKELYQTLQARNYPVYYMYSIKGFIAIVRSQYLIYDHGSKDISYILSLFGRFSTLQTWHGTPLKKIGLQLFRDTHNYSSIKKYLIEREYKKDTYICSPSSYVSQLLKNAFTAKKDIPITGYPRNDIFFDESLIQSDITTTLKTDKYQKIITYAPTYRDNNVASPFTQEFLSMLENFCTQHNYLIVLKLHPFDESILFDNTSYTHIIKVSKHIDLQELLVYTDMLITDYSSVFFDYMITQKPILYYCYDYDAYMQDRGMLLDYFADLPGPFIKTESELLNYLDTIDIWFHEETYKQRYNAFNDRFNFYKDGKSSQRVFDLITNMLQGKK